MRFTDFDGHNHDSATLSNHFNHYASKLDVILIEQVALQNYVEDFKGDQTVDLIKQRNIKSMIDLIAEDLD